jgi:hypothetical protein
VNWRSPRFSATANSSTPARSSQPGWRPKAASSSATAPNDRTSP